MKLHVRNYRDSDYDMIGSWWAHYKEPFTTRDVIPTDTTFILEYGGAPVACITLFLSNSKGYSSLEGFIKNPEYKDIPRAITGYLMEYACNVAKNLGYKIVALATREDRLVERYKENGFKITMTNATTMIKELR